MDKCPNAPDRDMAGICTVSPVYCRGCVESAKRVADGMIAYRDAKVTELQLQLREARKDAWEHCVRLIEAPIPGLEALATMGGDTRGLAGAHIQALREASTAVRESMQFMDALEKQKTEKRVRPTAECEAAAYVPGHPCPRCKQVHD